MVGLIYRTHGIFDIRHTVISGDTCSLIETSYGITFAQFQSWNPQIDAQCSNLLLGDA